MSDFECEGNEAWQLLSRQEPHRGRCSAEVHRIELAIEALLGSSRDPKLEGAWLDVTGDEPRWVDAALARRRASGNYTEAERLEQALEMRRRRM